MPGIVRAEETADGKSRTEAARADDDSDLIDDAANAGEATSSGGNLARDVASQAEESLIEDPEGRARINKEDDIAHGTEIRPDRARTPD